MLVALEDVARLLLGEGPFFDAFCIKGQHVCRRMKMSSLKHVASMACRGEWRSCMGAYGIVGALINAICDRRKCDSLSDFMHMAFHAILCTNAIAGATSSCLQHTWKHHHARRVGLEEMCHMQKEGDTRHTQINMDMGGSNLGASANVKGPLWLLWLCWPFVPAILYKNARKSDITRTSDFNV